MRSAGQAAVVAGFGLGGLLDFTVLHLVLQWHHMISNRVPPVTPEALRQNLFWDGVGLSVMWLITVAGVLLFLRALQQRESPPVSSRFIGLFLVGWGIFNILDGTLNHHVLGLHNVREDVADPHLWNLGFMAVAGVLLPTVGWAMVRAGRRRP